VTDGRQTGTSRLAGRLPPGYHRAMIVRLALVASVALLAAGPAAQIVSVDRVDRLTMVAGKAEPATYRGRKALKLVEREVNQGLGMAVLTGVEFANGTIETEIAGLPAAGAAEGSRGFVGIAFHVQKDPASYECFYLRPTNGRADDQLRRNHSTQYISEPEFPWQRLRQENPGVYESYVDLDAGAWTPIRIVVDGARAQFYVHHAPQPALVVNDLKKGAISGAVALWIGQGTEAYFSGLTITRR
jgi:hypothetical protein